MSFIGNIMKNMRVSQDDDYDYDDDYEFDGDDDDYEPQRGGFFKKSVDDDIDEERHARPMLFTKKQPQPQPRRSMEVTMIKPTSMDDSRDICDYLLDGKTVVLNMEGLHMEIAQRIIDFTSGAAYSMEGNLQKISNYIFIVTPSMVELSGDFQNILAGNSDVNINGLNMRV
ncbi:cell division protein SepF [Oribacterium sp. C9]|uniref:cell division protein SepF n=1 Tax=Oribacterium sp. C9 TaxID=1943579 RepID=UPI00098F0237|nr:cell division protein SepF [Oribacterium sp. C9]OON86015.1 cell division protein SepF [Oribacterium sp. C9]